MRRVASLTILLVMASVASVASTATPAARAQINDRITSASNLPDVHCPVRSLSPRNAAQPTLELPSFNPDPTPVITEFYGPAKSEAEKPTLQPSSAIAPEASVRTDAPSAQ
jgi:hypothetical protein